MEEEIDAIVNSFSGVKVFSATKARERGQLGDVITAWLKSNPDKVVIEKVVTQSSDSEFHCFTITLFYREVLRASGRKDRK